jgi:hypothetical protein
MSTTTYVLTDQQDYAPGATALITAGGFSAGSTIEFRVQHVADAGADGIFGTADDTVADLLGSGHDPWTVVDGGAGDLDGLANGSIVTTWYVNPDDSIGATFLLTAAGSGSDGAFGTADDALATNSFTDNVSVKLDQWSNGPAPDADGAGNDDEQWVNGNLGSSNAHYTEGQSVPYRAVFDDLEPGKQYSLTIEWDTLASGKYALDFLTSYDFSVAAPEPHPVPTLGVSGLSSGAVTLVEITADPQLLVGFNSGLTNGLSSGQPKGVQYFTLFGDVGAGAASAVSYSADYAKAQITVSFTYTGSAADGADSVVLAWGGHIASMMDWRDDQGETVLTAEDVNGSPYHMRLAGFAVDGVVEGIGNQDMPLNSSGTELPYPAFAISKEATLRDGGTVIDAVGDVIDYRILVSNIGNEALTGVSVIDQIEGYAPVALTLAYGDDNGDGELDRSELWVYTTSHTVTADDFLSADGDIDNVATGDTAQTDPRSATASVTFARNAAIDVEKEVSVDGGKTWFDADTAYGPVMPEGSGNPWFRFTVTNTGDVGLTNVLLTDTDFALDGRTGDAVTGDGAFTVASLAAGAKAELIYADAPFELGHHVDTATVTASKPAYLGTDPVTDADDAHYLGIDLAPSITVAKTGPATIAEGGADVTWQFVITNHSVATDPVTVTAIDDDKLGDLLAIAEGAFGGTIVLAAGDSFAFDVNPAGNLVLDAGQSHTNVVTVTAVDDEGNSASDTDDHTVRGADVLPGIRLVKTGPATVGEGGGPVTYSYVLTSQSKSTDPLSVTLVDDNGTPGSAGDDFAPTFTGGDANGNGLLDAGETWTYTATRTLELDGGQAHTNVATATGIDDEGNAASTSDDHTVTGTNSAPVVEIVKTGPATIAEGGADVTWHFVITNRSVATDPVTVTAIGDDKLGDLLAAALAANGGSPIVLEPGESFAFDFNPAGNLVVDAGESYTNVVTVTGVDDEGAAGSDSDSHTLRGTNVAPGIAIVKTGPETVDEGDTSVAYTYRVTSLSVVTDPLAVTLVDDDGAKPLLASGDANGNGLLDSNETWIYTATKPLHLNAGESHTNLATATGTDDEGNKASASDDHTVTAVDLLPSIRIDKTGPATLLEGGGSVTYTYTVTNYGASTDPLHGITLLDDAGTPLDPGDDFAPAFVGGDTNGNHLLETGEAWVFSATRAMTLNVGQTHTNVVVVNGTDDEGNLARDADWLVIGSNNAAADAPIGDTDDHTVTGANRLPVLQIEKLVDANGDGVFHSAEVIAVTTTAVDPVYRYTVTNHSAVTDPVEITTLVDDKLGNLLDDALAAPDAAEYVVDGKIVLDPGESFTFDVVSPTVNLGSSPWVNVVTVTGIDDEHTYGSATDAAAILRPGYVTNSSLCDFGDKFNLIFTPNFSQGANMYKLSDSNPGQFYYNAFYTGTPGTDHTFTINVPYPFVTQGANPLHVYSGVSVELHDGTFCFDPEGEIGSIGRDATFTLNPKGNSATVKVTVPDTGFVYVNLHLDYGLEKTDNWLMKPGQVADSQANPDLGTFVDFAKYAFSHLVDGSQAGQDTIASDNIFKRIVGIGGFVFDEQLSPDEVAGALVRVLDASGIELWHGQTDDNGWMYANFKAPGKAGAYTVQAYADTGGDGVFDEGADAIIDQEVVLLGGNTKYAQVDLFLDGGP